MKINSHSLIILLAIISIIIIFGVVYYYFQNNQLKPMTNNQTIKNENTQSDTLQSGGVEGS
jgi:preprotein translocase subunit YajC